ncbi:hypothetical protein V8B55DRAFT_1540044 [Mucor lusitanicus]|uniref:Uncharacterized protein n=2 Tax=Mucor circinelloides f. lusitanicus TaxID=29924 RepID=A0A168NAG6_MUCCL|nr:hypothetical protein FB192DRAFT_1387637 [Mucor lusitanicus]OAD06018.1 hypothetical protein MUCCIDRAFT_106580 [Mucor lusitanicus CBS 277.49]
MRASLFLLLIVAISTVLCTVPAAESDNEAAPRRRISANPDELVGKQDSFENANVDKHFVLNKESDDSPFVKVSESKEQVEDDSAFVPI